MILDRCAVWGRRHSEVDVATLLKLLQGSIIDISMATRSNPAEGERPSRKARSQVDRGSDAHGAGRTERGEPRPASLLLLVATLVIEAIAVAAAAIMLIVSIFTARANGCSDPDASLTALAVLTVIAAVIIAAVAKATFDGRSWIRGASLTIHILTASAAWLVAQGDFAPWIGWALLAVTIIGVACTLVPSTRGALTPLSLIHI